MSDTPLPFPTEVAPSSPGNGEVHLWILPVTPGNGGGAAVEGILPADERARLGRIRSPEGRRLFLASRRLLRETLSRYDQRSPGAWRFAADPGGKPRLDPPAGAPPLRFNLAHTPGLAVLAVTRGAEVGVDVERQDRSVRARALAARFFTPAEGAALAALSPGARRERFLHHWTLKEACLKALGHGLSRPLDSVGVALAGGPPARIDLATDPALAAPALHAALLAPWPGYVASVCLAGTGPLRLRGWLAGAAGPAPLALAPLALTAGAACLSA